MLYFFKNRIILGRRKRTKSRFSEKKEQLWVKEDGEILSSMTSGSSEFTEKMQFNIKLKLEATDLKRSESYELNEKARF